MPRRPKTAAEKKAISRSMKAAWKRRKQAATLTQTTETAMNGLLVEQRIVLSVQGQTFDIPWADVATLRDALNRIAPKADVEKLKALFELHERAEARNAKAAFNAAFAAMQGELPTIDETGAAIM